MGQRKFTKSPEGGARDSAKRAFAGAATPRGEMAGQSFKKKAVSARDHLAIPSSNSQVMIQRTSEPGDSKPASKIRFIATLLSPRRKTGKSVSWTFLNLPPNASAMLPSRGMTSVEGTFNGIPFRATLEPNGQGGHWLKVDRKMREGAGAKAGDVVTLEITPASSEPEPRVPADLRKALAADPKARKLWPGLTPAARRDWIQWIVSAKQAATRARRIGNACSMLAAGKRRPCCFDRSGMYSKSLSCPEADAT